MPLISLTNFFHFMFSTNRQISDLNKYFFPLKWYIICIKWSCINKWFKSVTNLQAKYFVFRLSCLVNVAKRWTHTHTLWKGSRVNGSTTVSISFHSKAYPFIFPPLISGQSSNKILPVEFQEFGKTRKCFLPIHNTFSIFWFELSSSVEEE